MRRWAYLITVAGAALLGICASASAANVILGNPSLPGGKIAYGCGGLSPEGCTFFNIGFPGSATLAQSPVGGAIVGWGERGGQPGEPGYSVRVLERRGQSLEFKGAGTSSPVTLMTGQIEFFNSNLPIHVGDYIGERVPEHGTIGTQAAAGATSGFLSGLADGSTKETGESASEVAIYAEVQPTPAITGVSPGTGPSNGGTAVDIAGTDLRGVTSVNFGTLPATSFSIESENGLVAIAPPAFAPQVVDITITTNAGTSQPTYHDFFEYTPVPVSPSSSPVCVVPATLGLRLKNAEKLIKMAHCAIGHVQHLKGPKPKIRRVRRQRPKPGRTLPKGTKVVITLQ